MALLCSLVNNAWFEKKKSPNDINPFAVSARRKKPKTTITDPRQLGWGTIGVVK